MGNGGVREDALEQATELSHRSRCDPIIYFDIAKNQCERVRAGRHGESRRAVGSC